MQLFSKKSRPFNFGSPSRRSLGLVLILTLTMLLGACGAETATSTGGTALASKTPGLTATSQPVLQLADCEKQATSVTTTVTPAVAANGGSKVDVPAGFKLFVSSVYPYALAYPATWDLQANQSRNDVKGDFFVASNQNNKLIFATVTGRSLPAGVSDIAGFFKSLEKDFAEQSVNYQRETDRKVGGANAYVIGFNTDQPGFQAQTVQVIFVAQNQAWNISYNASYHEPLSYCGDFVRMLNSFTFTGGAK